MWLYVCVCAVNHLASDGRVSIVALPSLWKIFCAVSMKNAFWAAFCTTYGIPPLLKKYLIALSILSVSYSWRSKKSFFLVASWVRRAHAIISMWPPVGPLNYCSHSSSLSCCSATKTPNIVLIRGTGRGERGNNATATRLQMGFLNCLCREAIFELRNWNYYAYAT